MRAGVPYTPYHPKWYRRRVSVWWWLQSWRYTKFVLRELTSLAVAFLAAVTLWQLFALGKGPEEYAKFVEWLKSPFFLFCHGIAFLFVLFHTITWFNLAPKAMVLRVGRRRVPDWVVAGLNYLAWAIATAAIAWLLLGAS